MKRTTLAIGMMALVGLLAGCSGTTQPEKTGNNGDYNFFPAGGGGKGDIAHKAHIVDEIALRSEIKGSFKEGYRVYGYVFEAKAGAVINANVDAVGGEESVDSAGEELDMIMGLYGPTTGEASNPGERLAYVDQSMEEGGTLPAVEIQESGKYMFVFSTWDDPAEGDYTVSLGCDGTDFQCMKPVKDEACDEGTLYIEGDTELETEETWSKCEVILLEPTTVEEGKVLTVEPGVTVKGNYLGEGTYGDVALKVNGTLQAKGTKANPVVFKAAKEGWKGLELYGGSNHLEHVFVEQAEAGITIDGGQNNTLREINVNSSKQGIVLENEGAAMLEDLVIRGIDGEELTGQGIVGRSAAPSEFTRSVVTGFETGIDLASSEFKFVDSTIANNGRGVGITGENSGLHNYPFQCPQAPEGNSGNTRSNWTPSNFGRDPYFLRTDVINNADEGIYVDAPELLIVEKSNVKGNGKGIEIHSTALHPDSHINQSNIYGNGENPQVDSWHVTGQLDISDNYWNEISDPELSASWKVEHTIDHECREDVRSRSNPEGGDWNCGNRRNYSSREYTWTCTNDIDASWQGEVNFSGFSPEELEAGPTTDELVEPVQQARQEAGL
jgi:hypothetical protein